MFSKSFLVVLISLWVCVLAYHMPEFETNHFKVGIEYENSLPMSGGSDRYRHRNNYEPFYVTISARAKEHYVISYLEVTTTTDITGKVEFCLLQGHAGSRSMTFQLKSNHTDFLYFNYLSYGIREEEYKKIANVIVVPVPNKSVFTEQYSWLTFICIVVQLSITS